MRCAGIDIGKVETAVADYAVLSSVRPNVMYNAAYIYDSYVIARRVRPGCS